jgi:hypothetical protein
MRISDADRDRAASVLANALAEGRLTADEHAERLDAIFAAKTHADLAPLVRDLPGAAAELASPAAPYASPARAGGRRNQVVAVFGGASRKGLWQVPATMGAVSVFGDIELDLRQATLAAGAASIRVTTVFGTTRITVPPEMHVVDDGWALFGGREIPPDTEESAGPSAPVLRVSGVSIFGLTTVRREPRPAGGELPALL